jgi:flagella synthesis protein FlgN
MPQQHSAFVAGLRSELAGFRELQQILLAEQDCLKRADVDALVRVTEIKSQQIERLKALAARRSDYLEHLRVGLDRRGMTSSPRAHAGSDAAELSAMWAQLLNAAAEARALNDINGALIAARLNHNQAALATLHAAGRTLSTYGPDGQTELRAGQRDLGTA